MTVNSMGLDELMERASEALARMEYLDCEQVCVQALASAKALQKWKYYSRILLPLQEVRRQRRMIAASGQVRLGTGVLEDSLDDWAGHLSPGCIVLTRPHSPQTAHALSELLSERRLYAEVLWADNPSDASQWIVRSFKGKQVSCTIAAPPAQWVDQWIRAGGRPSAGSEEASHVPQDTAADPHGLVYTSRTPTDWFIDASERLGDEALAQLCSVVGKVDQVDELEACLLAVPNHEILHQRLAEAAQALASIR